MASENNHVTKADLKALRDELVEAIRGSHTSLEQSLRAEIAQTREELIERIHDTETKLLNAFYGFADSTGKHLTQHDAHGERLSVIERRLTELERQVNFPPRS